MSRASDASVDGRWPVLGAVGVQVERLRQDMPSAEVANLLPEFLALAVGAARCQFDPDEQSDEFAQALWDQVDAGFGLTPGAGLEGDLPSVWFDDADDPDVVVWGRNGE